MTKVNNNYSVVLATNKKFFVHTLICKTYLYFKYGISSRIYVITDSCKEGDLVIGDNEILLPFSIMANKFSQNLPNCLVMNSREISFLEDKQSCAEFIDNLGIPNIPTFYNHKNQNEKSLYSFLNNYSDDNYFCIKERNSESTEGVKCYKKNEILSFYRSSQKKLEDNIIQLFIESDYLISIDCVCLKGKIESFFVNKSALFLGNDKKSPKDRYTAYETHYVLNENSNNIFYERIHQYTEKIINSFKYNGFIQIEWLCREKDNMLLFLEINPRVSGGILFSNYREIDNFSLPYIDVLVLKYVLIILKLKVEENKHTVKENKIIANLKSKIPDKNSLPTKLTQPHYNFVVRPILILLTILVLFFLVSKITIFDYDPEIIKGRK